MSTVSDNRSLARLPCRLAVSSHGRSAPLGEITDITLDGVHIETELLLTRGTVVPVAFTLGERGDEICPTAEVVYHGRLGMGLRFVKLTARDARRLRRFVGDLNLVVSQQEGAARLRDAAARTTEPIVEPSRIAALLEQSREATDFTIVPEARGLRQAARVVAIGPTDVTMRCQHICELHVGEPVLAIATLDAVSYSFQTVVTSVDDKAVVLQRPIALHYSERRVAARRAGETGAVVTMPLPWREEDAVRWSVVDCTAQGLSFRAAPKEVFFWPGTELPGLRLVRPDGSEETLPQAVVKHLTMVKDQSGADWLRVGIAFGVARQVATIGHVEQGADATAASAPVSARIAAWGRSLADKVAYLYHSRLGRGQAGEKAAPFTVVRFPNAAGRPLVGLLNRTFDGNEPVRAPVVVIAPGFAGRKETAAALAMTLVHNFRRHGRELAVLRFDGSNNLGESYKAPGCEADGKHMLKFTVQDGVDDMRGALTWIKNNRFVDPTDIIVISLSFAAISVRRTLTLPEASGVSRWIALMGPPDAVHSIANAMGNSDPYANYLRGVKNGIVTLFGCLVDGDHYCTSAHAMQVATLEDARRDMAAIRADCTWIVGKYDAFIDAKRVEDIMTVQAPGRREMIAVNAGHLPRTSDQALDQFALLTRQVWRHLYARDIDASLPSRGYLGAVAEQEWQRVRRARPEDERDYWRDYLLGDGGIGFDIWTVTAEYRQLIADQVRLACPAGNVVLDLGAGTGNLTAAMLPLGPKALTALDLVADALERVRAKAKGHPIEIVATSIDGSPRVAMRRFLAGELTPASLWARLPGRHAEALDAALRGNSAALFAIVRGALLPIAQVLADEGLPASLEPFVRDVHLLARVVAGRTPEPEAAAAVTPDFLPLLRSNPGLPFADASFDVIACSLVLSYLKHPDDALAEMRRVLVPGGTLVLSTMLPDSEGSMTYVNTVKYLESAPAEDLPAGHTREALIQAAHRFLDNACILTRLEEEGIFRFWSGAALARLVQQAGFDAVEVHPSFGQPPQAVIVRCCKT